MYAPLLDTRDRSLRSAGNAIAPWSSFGPVAISKLIASFVEFDARCSPGLMLVTRFRIESVAVLIACVDCWSDWPWSYSPPTNSLVCAINVSSCELRPANPVSTPLRFSITDEMI